MITMGGTMRKTLILPVVLLPLVVFVGGVKLPRTFQELGINVPFGLDTTVSDLDKAGGNLAKSDRFVALTTEGGQVLSITLSDDLKKVVKMVVLLNRPRADNALKIMKDRYAAGNHYEKEQSGPNEIHTWKDERTVIRLVSTQDFCRLELQARADMEK